MTVQQMASLGGKARAAKLSAKRRQEIARKAGKARKKKKSLSPTILASKKAK